MASALCSSTKAHLLFLLSGAFLLYAWLYIFCSECFFQLYREHTLWHTLSIHAPSAPSPSTLQPRIAVTILPSALTLDPPTPCSVSGCVCVWCRWHHPSQWVHCHLQLYCPLSAWQWAALSWRRTALARHAPSVNDERERGSCAESAGLVWPSWPLSWSEGAFLPWQ